MSLRVENEYFSFMKNVPWVILGFVSVGNDTYGITGIPSMVTGHGDREESVSHP